MKDFDKVESIEYFGRVFTKDKLMDTEDREDGEMVTLIVTQDPNTPPAIRLINNGTCAERYYLDIPINHFNFKPNLKINYLKNTTKYENAKRRCIGFIQRALRSIFGI